MDKEIYINGTGCISPQMTFDSGHFLDEVKPIESNRLKCIDPNYREFIPADMIRRMSRIIRMGVAASSIYLRKAGSSMPDAIITGTGLGCVEDTEKFLSTMILNKEEFLTPTAFIQSTHNTIGAQIALLLKCHNYNFTYVHRGNSFECALLDGMTRIISGKSGTVLLGGADELTDNSFTIMQRLGMWKRKPVNNLQLLEDNSKGTIAGEGAAFFLLSGEKKENSYARITDAATFIYPEDTGEVVLRIRDLLLRNRVDPGEIDLLVTGMNGNPADDGIYHEVSENLFPETGLAWFKHLCGEYHTSGSFALWLAAMILKNKRIPEVVKLRGPSGNEIKRILIYNHYGNINHSLILVSKA